jgi:hypothetical protein
MQPTNPAVKRYVREMLDGGNVTEVGFGPKMAWLAIRGDDPLQVLKALGLSDLGTADARSALDLAHFTDDRVVAVVVGDWVLVAGRWLFPFRGTASLSAALGTEVQSFATHRGLLVHRWERAVDGDLRDVLRYDAEHDDFDEDSSDEDSSTGHGDPALVDEGDVFAKAAEWSVDPRSLPARPFHIAAAPGNS